MCVSNTIRGVFGARTDKIKEQKKMFFQCHILVNKHINVCILHNDVMIAAIADKINILFDSFSTGLLLPLFQLEVKSQRKFSVAKRISAPQ